MARVIFTISYDVKPEKREEYMALTRVMRQHFSGVNGREYAIYEQKGKKNSFSEVFIFPSMSDYDGMEDQEESMTEVVSRLEGMLAKGRMRYSTLIEIE